MVLIHIELVMNSCMYLYVFTMCQCVWGGVLVMCPVCVCVGDVYVCVMWGTLYVWWLCVRVCAFVCAGAGVGACVGAGADAGASASACARACACAVVSVRVCVYKWVCVYMW